jgi:4-amino-4-deoxy-L-arabinose transferase-like glycosyltransferase
VQLRSLTRGRTGPETEVRTPRSRDSRRVWAIIAIAIATVGLAGALGSLREPQYWDAGGYYVQLAHDIYHDPTDLVLDSQPGIPNTPGHAIVIAVGWAVTGENVWMPHLVSLAAAALVLWAAYRLVRRYDNDGFTAVAAVAVLTAVPVFQSQARIAQPETLTAACLMLAMLSLAGRRNLAGSLWLVAATMAKITSIATVPLLAIWAGWWTVRRSRTEVNVREILKVALRVAAPAAAVLVGWLLYHNIVTHGATFSSGGLDSSGNPAHKDISIDYLLNRGWDRLRQLMVPAALGPLAVVAIAVGIARWRQLSIETRGIVVLGVLPAVSLLPTLTLFGVPLPRYVTPMIAPLVCSLVLLAAARGRVSLGIGAGLSLLVGMAFMWRTLPWLPPVDLTRKKLLLPSVAIVLTVTGVLARMRRETMATAAGVLTGLLLLCYVWGTTSSPGRDPMSTPGGPDPESNLSYRYLLARDQKVMDVVLREARTDRTLIVTADYKDDFGQFPYNHDSQFPYLGWVDEAIPFLAPTKVPCRYLLISTPEKAKGHPVERVVAVIRPDSAGRKWAPTETREVSIANCALKQGP